MILQNKLNVITFFLYFLKENTANMLLTESMNDKSRAENDCQIIAEKERQQ